MTDQQLFALNLILMSVHLAPELTSRTRQIIGIAWFVAALVTATRIIF